MAFVLWVTAVRFPELLGRNVEEISTHLSNRAILTFLTRTDEKKNQDSSCDAHM
jgi:hypothetical protein